MEDHTPVQVGDCHGPGVASSTRPESTCPRDCRSGTGAPVTRTAAPACRRRHNTDPLTAGRNLTPSTRETGGPIEPQAGPIGASAGRKGLLHVEDWAEIRRLPQALVLSCGRPAT